VGTGTYLDIFTVLWNRTITIFTVPVPTFEKFWFRFRLLKKLWLRLRFRFLLRKVPVPVPVPVPAPYLDHKKQVFQKKL
jgi:hypothetical protein